MPRNRVTPFDIKIRKTIAANIDKFLKIRGFTQDKLSDLTGIPQSTLSGYMRATSTPDCGQIQKIAFALGVQKSDIDPIRFTEQTEKLAISDDGLRMAELFNSLSPEDQKFALKFASFLLEQSKNH